MRRRIGASLAVGALSAAAALTCANANTGRELLFSAPVQQLDRSTDTVTVLGQKFQAQSDQLAVGQIVNVYGILDKDGSITNAVVEGTPNYGANGDPVFVKGVVTNVDALLGQADVDGLTVDFTSQLGNPQFVAPSVGDVIAIAGSEPVAKGLLVATATGDSAYQMGITAGGTSVAGVSGVNVSGTALIASGAGLAGGTTAAAGGMSGGGTAAAGGMSGGGTAAAGGMSGGGTAAAGGMSGGGTAAAGGMSGGGTAAAGGMSGGGTAAAGGMSGGGTAAAGGMSGGGTAAAGGMSGGGTAAAGGMSGGGTAAAGGMSGGGTAAAVSGRR